ncbi:hypothetical protein [Methylobacterium radiodurans]|uniref:Uncharacterized protein n=1 Tax=Methylobacterium radiodurans TaxID=2202828 RepID=A0A2U8VMQ9_9HYPH|nr:hypothetical protein [Methylobacterium radiodurans]AWN34672.1 hypothetical protein DK427_02080 [Methylobacterium radiodurans]
MTTKFSTPAFVDDLDEAGRAAWAEALHSWFQDAAGRLPEGHRFFNVVDDPAPAGSPTALIPWNAFPRKFTLRWPDDVETRWRTAETVVSRDMNDRRAGYYEPAGDGKFRNANLPFRDQDEYCEWRCIRDPGTGRLKSIVFTCENPEYWTTLAEQDRDKLLKLYRQLVGEQVQPEDLFFQTDIFVSGEQGPVNLRGRYNPLNKWNTTDGLVHLTHPANSLQAEIYLAADATVLRTDGTGQVLTDDARLICCAAYGSPNRSSDPTIGGKVNELVRNGLKVTIADPVGLYIGELDLAPIEVPGGATAADCWKVLRGRQDDRLILRAEFSPPEGADFELADVLVGGEPLRYGGQLAELITIVIHGVGVASAGDAPRQGCDYKCCRVPASPRLVSIVEIDKPCPEVPLTMEVQAEGSVLPSLTASVADVVSADALPRTVGRI